mmetsp:Transcript_129/g.188  ORF Transcript_129/g.188 Transcript_129/m.188 type:complete len:127 (+) Transcript_129:410-790(+)
MDEISILRELSHPNIIRLYDAFDEPLNYFLVTEMMSGGELFDRIVQKEAYNEKEARDVCKVLFDAIFYCHDQNVAHRDLKPQVIKCKLQGYIHIGKWRKETVLKKLTDGFFSPLDNVQLYPNRIFC